MPHQMAILLDFIKVNRLRLVDWFFRFDKDRSGDISRDEFKAGLKEIGLKMTQVFISKIYYSDWPILSLMPISSVSSGEGWHLLRI